MAVATSPLYLAVTPTQIGSLVGAAGNSWTSVTITRPGRPSDMNKISDIKIVANLSKTLISLGTSCTVEVIIQNMGRKNVLLNSRLAVGYRDNLSRELFADLLDPVSGQPIQIAEVDYDRDFSSSSDYIYLEPGRSISGSFDLLEWYTPSTTGTYRLVVHYQADEPLASTPEDIVRGIHTADPVDLTICKMQHEKSQTENDRWHQAL